MTSAPSALTVPGTVYLLSSAIVAYGLSRIKWRGRTAVFFTVLFTMMIPFPVLMAPLYVIFRQNEPKIAHQCSG